MKSLKLAGYAFAMLASLALASAAQAHTISMGVYNAGAPGSVTVSMGTYDHGTPIAQGFIQLIAGPGTPSAVVPFSSFVLVKPVGLVDGVTNFYADAVPATWGTLPSDSYHSPTNTVGLGPVINWQEATFTGLTAGVYTYQLSGMTSANWSNINSFQDNWTGTLVITDDVVVGVPEPTSMAIFGIGAIGMAGSAWRRRNTKATAKS